MVHGTIQAAQLGFNLSKEEIPLIPLGSKLDGALVLLCGLWQLPLICVSKAKIEMAIGEARGQRASLLELRRRFVQVAPAEEGDTQIVISSVKPRIELQGPLIAPRCVFRIAQIEQRFSLGKQCHGV